MSSSALAAGIRQLRGRLARERDANESDEQLLHAFTVGGEESAFAALVGRHGPMVLHVCRRVLGHEQDAEDAFQATFVVLARKHAALRDKSALVSFLHGTAYRMAMNAKRSAARRRKHENRTPPRSPANPATELLWREVQTLLDEEIVRLPEIYRSVFILCCLENVSQAEAARRLGVKEGTVSSRLTEARKRLQRRLSRRGVELTALLTAAALATPPVSALPAALLAKTTGTALSPAIAALADSGESILGLGKAKASALLLLAASMMSGAGLWACRSLATPQAPPAESPAAKAEDKPKAAPSKRETAETVEIQGRVLGPNGQPKVGAKLLSLGAKIEQLGVSAADGRFTVTIPKEPKYRSPLRYLLAQADGTGIDFIDLPKNDPKNPIELRLVKDHAIRGRVVNTEGKPIRGVRVAAEDVEVYPNNSLEPFLAAYLKLLAGGKGYGTLKQIWSGAGALFAATTDADGRFVLHGLGAERTVHLRFGGGGIADTSVWVANRAGFDPQPYNQAFRDYFTLANGRKDQHWMLSRLLSAPDVSLFAEAEKVIRGVVTDADSGKAQPGLVVQLTRDWDESLLYPLKTKTDAEGRYEIHGVRKAKQYLVQFLSDAATGYTPSEVWAEDTTGYQPVAADLKVKKGVIVTGKVIDGATGEAIPGTASAAVLSDNPFVKDYPKFDTPSPAPYFARSEEMDDGAFRLVTLPGPVLLMGGPNHNKPVGGPFGALKYKQAVADPKYPKYFQVGPGATNERRLTYFGLEGFRRDVGGNFCKVLDTKPGIAVVKQDIVLERGSVRTVTVQDAEGRPLAGAWATGISPLSWYRAIPLESDSCPAYHLEAGKSRLLVFYEPTRKLAGSRTLKGDEKEPIVVKLGSAGSVKGHLLDADDKPLAGIAVDLRYRANEAEQVHGAIHKGKQIVTDAAGAFTFDELIPELTFELSFRRGRRPLAREPKPAEATVSLKPGECRDLGAIKLKPLPEKAGG